MCYNHTAFDFRISHQPAVRAIGEIGLSRGQKLVLGLHPCHDLSERLNDIRFIGRSERVAESALHPPRKVVFSPLQFLVDAIDAPNPPVLRMMNQTFPEPRSQVECIITAGRLNEDVGIKDICRLRRHYDPQEPSEAA